MSVTHGQCNARPTVTFPAIEHHRPLAGTNLYFILLVNRGTCVNNLPKVIHEAEWLGLEPVTYWLQDRCPNHCATMLHIMTVPLHTDKLCNSSDEKCQQSIQLSSSRKGKCIQISNNQERNFNQILKIKF